MMLLHLQVFVNPVKAEPDFSIAIEPAATAKVPVGANFTINVTVQECVDVYAVQVDFHYNYEVLEVLSVQAGDFLEGGFVLVANSTIYDEEVPPYARVLFVQTLLGGGVGNDGGGLLFNVTFEVLSEGSSEFVFISHVPHSDDDIGTFFLNNPPTEEKYPAFHHGVYGTPITITALPSRVEPGKDVIISGRVAGAESSQDVTIQYSKDNGAYTNVTTLSTNGTGFFSYTWVPTETGSYDIKVITLILGLRAESNVVTVRVESPFNIMLYAIIGVVVAGVVIIVVVLLLRRRKAKKPEVIPETEE